MKFFILSIIMLLQIVVADEIKSSPQVAQFWHPDSFHSAYYLPGNYQKAIESGDSVGARLIRGTQYLNLKQYNKAYILFESAQDENSKLKPYLQIMMAEALIAQANYPQADSIITLAAAKIPKGPGLDYLVNVWIEMLIADSSHQIEMTKLDSNMQAKFGLKYTDSWSVELALLNYMSDEQLVEIFSRRMSSDDFEIQQKLRKWFDDKKAIQTAVDQDSKLKMMILEYDASRQAKEFFKSLKSWSKTNWSSSELARLEELKAKAYYAIGDFPNAIKYYKKLVSKKSQPLSHFYLQLARSYRKNNQSDKANYYYGVFQKKFPTHTKTAEMIWTRATKFEAAGELSKAEELFRRIDRNFKSDKRHAWAVFKIAMMYYKKGEWQRAAEVFEEVYAKRKGLWSGNGAYFLRADALYKLGKKEEAKKEFIRSIEDFPLSYYAHLARQHLEEYKLLKPDQIPTIKPLQVTDLQAQAWMRSKTGEKDSTDSWSPEYQESFERLLQMGRWESADFLYASSPKNLRWRLDFVLKYSQLYLKHGYLAQSYRLARRIVQKISRKHLDQAPMQFYDVTFPKPHYDWIQAQTEGSKVDPLFVLALMRQESIFDDQIFSPVGASGLMQIMPYTGTPLAKAEGISTQYDHALLRNPLMAIRLGTRYLKDLYHDWDAEYEYMLANYNAGPKPTKRWKKANQGLDPKIAFEEITYWETRNYIKKCMGNYWNYKLLENYRRNSNISPQAEVQNESSSQAISSTEQIDSTRLISTPETKSNTKEISQ